MTRRLDPMERVRELGDASVPFNFDVHGMIFSEDAPGLEHKLHQRFHERRVNLINLRRELYYVTLDDIEAFTVESGVKLELTRIAEARQYRETIAMKNGASETAQARQAASAERFPESI